MSPSDPYLSHISLPYTNATGERPPQLFCPMQLSLHWAYGLPNSLGCGRQVPDVAIPHYRDAMMQHSPMHSLEQRPQSRPEECQHPLTKCSLHPQRKREDKILRLLQRLTSARDQNLFSQHAIDAFFSDNASWFLQRWESSQHSITEMRKV